MESGMTGAPAMGQNPAAQDLIGTVSAISNSLMNEVGKVIIGKPQNLRRVTVGILSNGNMLLKVRGFESSACADAIPLWGHVPRLVPCTV